VVVCLVKPGNDIDKVNVFGNGQVQSSGRRRDRLLFSRFAPAGEK
jgi:hypothetical protein